MSIRKRSKGLYVIRWLDGGKAGIYRQETFEGTLDEARKREAILKGEAAKRTAPPSRLTFSQLIDRYLEVKGPRFAPRWRSQVEVILRGRLEARFGRMPLRQLRAVDVVRYRNDRANEVSGSTINRETTLLMGVLNFAEEEGWLERNPVPRAKVRRFPEPKRTRAFTPEEWRRFRSAFDDPRAWEEERSKVRRLGPVIVDPGAESHVITTKAGWSRRGTLERRYGGGLRPDSKASHALRRRMGSALDFFTALLVSACRRGELLDLRWKDVDTRGGTVRIGLPKTARRGLATKTLPLVSGLKALIEAQRRGVGDAHVFRDPEGTPWQVQRLERAFKLALKLAGLKDEQAPASERFVIHSIRHTAETWLARADVSTAKRNAYLGHTDGSVAERYTHLLPQDLATLVEVLSREAGLAEKGGQGDAQGDAQALPGNPECPQAL